MKLSGREIKELRNALTDAFRSKAKLKMLIRESDLDINIEEIVFGENLNDVVFEIINWAEERSKLDIFINAAFEDNPGNAQLKAFVQKRQNSKPSTSQEVLEIGQTASQSQFDVFLSEVRPIGFEYRFIVRSLERFSTDDEVYLNNLCHRWDALEEILENRPNEQDVKKRFQSLYKVDNCNWDELETNWLFGKMFAIKVNCLPNSHVEQRKFFQTILKAGVPISLWARSDNLLDIDTFDSLLTVKHLRNFNHFFESVWKLRRLAYAKQDKTSYLGYHLGFLCDNPYRLPFCLMPENQDFIETGY